MRIEIWREGDRSLVVDVLKLGTFAGMNIDRLREALAKAATFATIIEETPQPDPKGTDHAPAISDRR